MQKQIKILLTIFTILILAISCAENNPNEPTTPAWKNNPNHDLLKKSWYDIANANLTYNYDGTIFSSSFAGTVSYSFTVEEIVWNSDNTSGIIYGKYTTNTSSPELVGKYYAVSFKSLTAESVSIVGAIGGVSSTDTLEEAKTTFTEANGYFNQYSDCKVYTGSITMDTTNWKDRTNYQLLQQTWETSATSTTSKVFKYTDNANNNTGALNSYHTYPAVLGMNYNIVIEVIGWISDTEGIMYGKFKYISDYSLLNKYYAIAFRNLTANSVEFSEASLANKQYTETLEEATNTFTIASGAFSTYNSYTVYIP